MKYIFLDFDGCLIPSKYKNFVARKYKESEGEIKSKDEYGFLFSPICFSKINFVIEITKAKVVIISDWKERNSLEQLKAMWSSRRMSGEIDVITDTDTKMRSDAIVKYIKDNNVEEFVIIDDLPSVEYDPTLHSRLLTPDPRHGIDNSIMYKIFELFKVQLLSGTD